MPWRLEVQLPVRMKGTKPINARLLAHTSASFRQGFLAKNINMFKTWQSVHLLVKYTNQRVHSADLLRSHAANYLQYHDPEEQHQVQVLARGGSRQGRDWQVESIYQ